MADEAAPAPPDSIALRHLMVIARRMEGLEQAIRERDWDATEFCYDQVLRACQKFERVLTPAVIATPGLEGVALHAGDDLEVELT